MKTQQELIDALTERAEKAEAELAETCKEYIATRDEVDRWKRMFNREYDSRQIETAELAELRSVLKQIAAIERDESDMGAALDKIRRLSGGEGGG